MRKIAACFVVLVIGASSVAQDQIAGGRWGENTTPPNATLVLKESGREKYEGKTVITYNLFAAGFPKDQAYTLWTKLLGSNAEPAADAFINSEGKIVSQLAKPQEKIAEDLINLKVFAGRGEPKQFALTSLDGKLRAFAQVVPFPIESTDKACRLTAVMTGPNYVGILITATGFQPDEDLVIVTSSGREGGQIAAKASHDGRYVTALFPFVKGERSGELWYKVTAKACKVGVKVPWGDGSYKLQ